MENKNEKLVWFDENLMDHCVEYRSAFSGAGKEPVFDNWVEAVKNEFEVGELTFEKDMELSNVWKRCGVRYLGAE